MKARDYILITGGAGFIGSNLVRYWLKHYSDFVLNIDKLTYAGNPHNLGQALNNTRHLLVQADICDSDKLSKLLEEHRPRSIIHLAAETHVDKSILGPAEFIQSNVVGTHNLLQVSTEYWKTLSDSSQSNFRFLHVSTDEVYGSLNESDLPCNEEKRYSPNSPYAASKAAADHVVRAYHQTYGLPVLITNCSNNFGAYQHPEKLIPLVICRAINGEPIPVYGDGKNIRDWLYVEDHCSALDRVLNKGKIGETYNISSQNEHDNLSLVSMIIDLLNELNPDINKKSCQNLIEMVPDRPGHDRRYALDPGKLISEISWSPNSDFTDAMRETIKWYINNPEWVGNNKLSKDYSDWIHKNYEQRGIE